MRLWVALVLFSQTTWAGGIATVISTWLFGPGPAPVGSPPFLLQKAYHVFLFGTYGWLLARSGPPRSTPWALTLAVGLSVFAESLQLLAPNRHPQVADAILNIAAATLFWAAAAGVFSSRTASTAR